MPRAGRADRTHANPESSSRTTILALLVVDYSHPGADVEFTYRIDCRGSEAGVTGDVEAADVDAEAACESLTETAVVERLVEGPTDDICTEIYGGADVATIDGNIGDQIVTTTVDRTDGCAIADWDELLAPVLPPPIGVGPSS